MKKWTSPPLSKPHRCPPAWALVWILAASTAYAQSGGLNLNPDAKLRQIMSEISMVKQNADLRKLMSITAAPLMDLEPDVSSGRYDSSIRDYSVAGCNIIAGFLERIAGRAGLIARGQCVHVAGAQYTVRVDFKGSPAAAILAYQTPACIGMDGYPFTREAKDFAFEANLAIQTMNVSYEVGGPAFCRPGLFNKLDISWKTFGDR
ncbi:MAG TPA: hypothetical protein DCZ01_05945 [Elusimicrobia bacterium]|nr:MAG: hypothetical protein A2X37_06295 [Elusimicrobia bacterium GWA2_66_18]HAZ08058.1 hypothetical protein [Elusimicrobiota bacterium]